MKLTFPPIGARIIKSSVAVGLCMIVYFIRTLLPVGNGIPFYGALAALWCIQPYADTTKNNALQRSAGTIIGAAYGLLFLLLFRRLGIAIPELVYISASLVINNQLINDGCALFRGRQILPFEHLSRFQNDLID